MKSVRAGRVVRYSLNEAATIPNQPQSACGTIQNAGRAGFIPEQVCGLFTDVIAPVCGCGLGPPTFPLATMTPSTAAPATPKNLASWSNPSVEPIDPPSVQSPSSLSPRCDVCGHDESSRTLTKLLQFPTSPKLLALLYRMLVSRGSFQS